jgi:hypothetical protein
MIVPEEALRLMERGATVTEAARAVKRSNLSSRSRVLREANRRGKWFGVASRVGGGKPIGRAEARLLAAESVDGRDPYGNCAVPAHWRPLFRRVFVKAAVRAAHAERSVTVSSA